jgi:hypothetical protein
MATRAAWPRWAAWQPQRAAWQRQRQLGSSAAGVGVVAVRRWRWQVASGGQLGEGSSSLAAVWLQQLGSSIAVAAAAKRQKQQLHRHRQDEASILQKISSKIRVTWNLLITVAYNNIVIIYFDLQDLLYHNHAIPV